MKKKKLLVFTLVFVAIVVFVVFYFKDNTDTSVVEKKQDASAVEAADQLLEDLNASFDNIDFEEEVETDTVVQ